MIETLVSLDDIKAAAERVTGVARRTPIIPTVKPGVFLKCENMQPMGAFKQRGAYNMISQLPKDVRARGVITYSSGNHGQAVAMAAQILGVPAVIVMPETAPKVKAEGARAFGAEVVFAGRTSFDRKYKAEEMAAERGLTIVPPFDHEWIIAGQGTVGLEILDQCPGVNTIFVPVGGGGLISGVSTAIKTTRPEVTIIGVEPAGAAKMSTSLAAGEPVTLEKTASIADGLLTMRPGDLTFAHVKAYVDLVVTVTDEQIAAAVNWLFRTARIVAEPSGAATTAAILTHGAPPGTTVAVVSGGNVAPEDFAKYIATAT
jgi:threo-3-hydroxy-L-aspartate ammonia-lyase